MFESTTTQPRHRWLRLPAMLVLTLILIGLLWIGGASLLVHLAARGKTYSDVNAVPHRRAAVVLGCARVLYGGWHNSFFDNRIEAAVKLFRAGKVDYVIVSGDNHVRGYDEPQDMKDALVQAGVPAERIYCDYAGFRTFDSIVRAREVFGQSAIIVVSQKFHNERAIFIAQNRGMDAIGFNAPEVDAYYSFDTRVRELFARANMLLDLFVVRRQPRFLGARIALPPITAQNAKLAH